ncbi:hypothetical protein D5R81_09450 [Parashewanella spongiae]|uniref:Uncharacterized protein n=1 Tax=Parashewanella spongiae TaxID=342950 RepID=A0A3A6TU79_9GAMM|nr:hypothetical protein [Parashewanella spongiae]MCL1078117.1 hypothetical protein [Parashewanella spongiae]RJY16363.1 hypothetical protein D5R81_09450 [Parashewanella spongiae]
MATSTTAIETLKTSPLLSVSSVSSISSNESHTIDDNRAEGNSIDYEQDFDELVETIIDEMQVSYVKKEAKEQLAEVKRPFVDRLSFTTGTAPKVIEKLHENIVEIKKII